MDPCILLLPGEERDLSAPSLLNAAIIFIWVLSLICTQSLCVYCLECLQPTVHHMTVPGLS